MTVKGILAYRLLSAASFIVAGAVVLIDAVTAGSQSGSGVITLIELGLAVFAFSLAARSLASRIEMRGEQWKLHGLLRTVRVDVARVERVVHGRFFGWDVLLLGLSDGRSVRLPLLTQPGDPAKLDKLERAVTTALGELGPSSTTPP